MLSKFGNWIFHYRNFLFPLFYAALFIPSLPIFHSINWAIALGTLFIAMGILVRSVTIGLVYIIRGGKKRQIYAEKLVTTGIYSVCRNPMYLGNILLLLGFGIFANSLLFLLIFFPLFYLFYMAIMRAEENFLIKKFPVDYSEYKRNTNSLVPNFRGLGNIFKDFTMNWIRVIQKEYNSLCMYLSGMLMLLFYHKFITFSQFAILLTANLAWYLVVKYLKKSGELDKK